MYGFKVDRNKRVCLIQKATYAELDCYQKHGPAFHDPGDKTQLPTDSLFAFKCETCPELASEWLARDRIYDWPSADVIKECKSLGVLLVYASHPQGVEKEFQWRISFSEQERFLLTQFNDVQLMCYIFLKFIKKELIKTQIKEDTLTSYHFKTCMLYMIERTSSKLWIPANLVCCLLMCLRQIRAWIDVDNCPNYFIPEENMFDRIVNKDLMVKLGKVMDEIIDSDFENLFNTLKTDDLGRRMQGRLPDHEIILHNVQYRKILAMSIALADLSRMRNILFHTQYAEAVEAHIERYKVYIQRTDPETAIAKSLILPFINVAKLSNKVVKMIKQNDASTWQMLQCQEWREQWPIDCYSKLKQASAMLMCGDYITPIELLQSTTNQKKLSFCSCSSAAFHFPWLNQIVGSRHNINVTYVLADYLQPCVVFLPAEQIITPITIRFEMCRGFALTYVSENFWHKWGVVDGNFLAHFLLYLCGKEISAKRQVKKMILLLNKKSVRHRETCLNLLGWASKDSGDIQLAVKCFQKSLACVSSHNAAFWHLCFLICDTVGIFKGRQ